jgi:hypothetical protein
VCRTTVISIRILFPENYSFLSGSTASTATADLDVLATTFISARPWHPLLLLLLCLSFTQRIRLFN